MDVRHLVDYGGGRIRGRTHDLHEVMSEQAEVLGRLDPDRPAESGQGEIVVAAGDGSPRTAVRDPETGLHRPERELVFLQAKGHLGPPEPRKQLVQGQLLRAHDERSSGPVPDR